MDKKPNSLLQLAFQKFKQNKIGLLSFYFIIFCGLIAIFCYVLAPDNSNSANQIHLEIHSKKISFSVEMLTIPSKEKIPQSWFNIYINGKRNFNTEIPIKSYKITNNQLEISNYSDGLTKIFPLLIFNNQPKKYIQKKTFYFGTDKYGRDLLSRLLIGSRISFFIGFIAVFISLFIGIPMGAIAGYFGGKIDAFIMWIINIIWSIPTLLLVIAITLALGKGIWQVFIAVGLTMWVEVARVVRGQVISTKQQQYVEASKALGFSNFRIILNIFYPIL